MIGATRKRKHKILHILEKEGKPRRDYEKHEARLHNKQHSKIGE